MNIKPNTSWTRRILSTLTGIFVVLLVYDGAMNLMTWHFIQETCQEHPYLSAVPVPPPDRSSVPLNGMQIKAFEYSLQIPWNDADIENNGKLGALWHFKRGATLLLFDPLSENDEVKIMRGATDKDAKKITQILGSRALSSNYDFMAAELATTPSQIKWWSSRRAKARSLVFLNLKSMELLESNSIYLQSSEEMHGFQFGNPTLPPYKVMLNLYDRNDRCYRILITGKDPNHPVLTQPELNAMVASLKPIPHS